MSALLLRLAALRQGTRAEQTGYLSPAVIMQGKGDRGAATLYPDIFSLRCVSMMQSAQVNYCTFHLKILESLAVPPQF